MLLLANSEASCWIELEAPLWRLRAKEGRAHRAKDDAKGRCRHQEEGAEAEAEEEDVEDVEVVEVDGVDAGRGQRT